MPGSSPDLSIAPAHLLPFLTWSVYTKLNSDHIPILVSFLNDDSRPCARHSFTNFRCANWPGFIRECESNFALLPPPTSCARDERRFRDILVNASKHHISSGYCINFIPGPPNFAKSLIAERDTRRSSDSSDPTLPALNTQIDDAILTSKRQAWKEKVETCNHKSDPGKCWSLLKSLSGENARPSPNQSISFKGKVFTKAPAIACNFCNFFTKTVPHKSDPRTRKVICSLKAKHKLDTTFAPFTSTDTLKAINAAKSSSATGPDGLTVIHLKQLGHYGLAYLTALFNLSASKADLPAIWKPAVIVPVLKPGKSADSGSSYRPILLLSPAAKVFERPMVTEALPKSSSQHGFAPAHSCIMALLPIATRVAFGFNNFKLVRRSAFCAMDNSKAFNSRNHTLLIEQIAVSTLHPNLIRWLSAYIRGRTATATALWSGAYRNCGNCGNCHTLQGNQLSSAGQFQNFTHTFAGKFQNFTGKFSKFQDPCWEISIRLTINDICHLYKCITFTI
jgi:hypothetical protein